MKHSIAEIHRWLKYHFGKANKLSCEFCGKKARDWALRKGCNYDKRIEYFIPLCRSCHMKYDMTEKQLKHLKEINLGRSQTREHIINAHKKQIGRKRSKEFRKKCRERMLGTKLCKKTRMNMSKSQRRRWRIYKKNNPAVVPTCKDCGNITKGYGKRCRSCAMKKVKLNKLK